MLKQTNQTALKFNMKLWHGYQHRFNLCGTRGTGTPTFWTEGTIHPLFEMKRWISDQSFAPDPARRAHDTLLDPRVGWGGDTSSQFFSPVASGPKGLSPSELVPPFIITIPTWHGWPYNVTYLVVDGTAVPLGNSICSLIHFLTLPHTWTHWHYKQIKNVLIMITGQTLQDKFNSCF